MVDLVFLLLGCLCHNLYLTKLEIRAVMIPKGVGCVGTRKVLIVTMIQIPIELLVYLA